MVKLGELLKGGNFDCELFKRDFDESCYSFVWDEEAFVLTDEGKKRFKKLLDSEVRLINGNIEIVNTEAPYAEYELFLRSCAGYVSTTLFDKWFKDV